MNLNQELIDKINYKCPDLITTRVLMEMGVFTSTGHAAALRDRGEGPIFNKHWNGSVSYEKKHVLDWLKKTPLHFRGYRHIENDGITHSVTIRISDRILRKLVEETKKDGRPKTVNKWISYYLNQQFKDVPAPTPKEAPSPTEEKIVSLSQATHNPHSKFLTMQLFSETYPSFRPSFFKRMLRSNPDFVKKVMIKNGHRYFVNVEAFWKYLENFNVNTQEGGEAHEMD